MPQQPLPHVIHHDCPFFGYGLENRGLAEVNDRANTTEFFVFWSDIMPTWVVSCLLTIKSPHKFIKSFDNWRRTREKHRLYLIARTKYFEGSSEAAAGDVARYCMQRQGRLLLTDPGAICFWTFTSYALLLLPYAQHLDTSMALSSVLNHCPFCEQLLQVLNHSRLIKNE